MNSRLQETRWSLVLRAQGDSPTSRVALSELCEIYYLPVRRFIARYEGEQEADDLTHTFFAQILESHRLANAIPRHGRFRNYLYGAVRHFLSNERSKQHSVKRGGNLLHLSLEEILVEDTDSAMPDREFDRSWVCAMLNRAIGILSDEMEAKGKKQIFDRLRPSLSGANVYGDQLTIATELGISETAMRVTLHRMRRRLREIVESEVAHTIAPGADIAAELRHLLGAW